MWMCCSPTSGCRMIWKPVCSLQRALPPKPGLPVLYTTGHGVTDGMRAMFADPFGFLPKPYTPDDLSTALGNLLALETSGPKSVETAGKKDRGG